MLYWRPSSRRSWIKRIGCSCRSRSRERRGRRVGWISHWR